MILFDSSRFLALDKPSGLSMATPRGGELEAVERLVEAAGLPSGSSDGLLLVHRLDVGTSGVVLLAKDAEAHRAASLLFQERNVEKTYRAIVWGHPKPSSARIDAAMAIDREDRRKMKVSAAGKPALTDYRTLERLPSVAHVELSPKTGRTHQLRVHLASRGHPIVGDDLYGGPRWRGVRGARLRTALREVSRLLLHAHRLEFVDPFSGGPIRIESPEPEEFGSLLRTARAGDGT